MVPVGTAWQKFTAKHVEPLLDDRDQSHPSHAGSYFAACVFLTALLKINPVGIVAGSEGFGGYVFEMAITGLMYDARQIRLPALQVATNLDRFVAPSVPVSPIVTLPVICVSLRYAGMFSMAQHGRQRTLRRNEDRSRGGADWAPSVPA